MRRCGSHVQRAATASGCACASWRAARLWMPSTHGSRQAKKHPILFKLTRTLISTTRLSTEFKNARFDTFCSDQGLETPVFFSLHSTAEWGCRVEESDAGGDG